MWRCGEHLPTSVLHWFYNIICTRPLDQMCQASIISTTYVSEGLHSPRETAIEIKKTCEGSRTIWRVCWGGAITGCWSSPQKTPYIQPKLVQCWATVAHWADLQPIHRVVSQPVKRKGLSFWEGIHWKLDNFWWYQVLGTCLGVTTRGDVEFESGAIFCNSRWRVRWPPTYSHI